MELLPRVPVARARCKPEQQREHRNLGLHRNQRYTHKKQERHKLARCRNRSPTSSGRHRTAWPIGLHRRNHRRNRSRIRMDPQHRTPALRHIHMRQQPHKQERQHHRRIHMGQQPHKLARCHIRSWTSSIHRRTAWPAGLRLRGIRRHIRSHIRMEQQRHMLVQRYIRMLQQRHSQEPRHQHNNLQLERHMQERPQHSNLPQVLHKPVKPQRHNHMVPEHHKQEQPHTRCSLNHNNYCYNHWHRACGRAAHR